MAEFDLTQPGRRTSQRRITSNRDGVLPNRRNTETPNVAIRADMRAASRGDGGVDELRRVLDGFTGAVQNADRAYVAGSMDRRRSEAAQGAMDAQVGNELADASSGAYREAFYRERAQARFNEFAPTVTAQAQDLIAAGRSPEEIEVALLESVGAFRDDILETIPTALGRSETAERLSRLGGELETRLATGLRERTQTQFVETAQGNLQARIRRGEGIAFDSFVGNLGQGGIAPTAARRAGLEAVFVLALDRDAPRPELLEELLATTESDGVTPSLSPAEQMQVQDRLTQANAIRDQVERDRKEETVENLWAGWLPRLLDGEYVDAEISSAMRDETIDGPTGLQLLNTTAALRDAFEEGHVDRDAVLDLQVRMATDQARPSREQLSAWYREGLFGTGTAATRAYLGLLGDVNARARAERVAARASGAGGNGISSRQERSRNISTARGFLWNTIGVNAQTDRAMREFAIELDRRLTDRIQRGEDPLEAARALVDGAEPWLSGRRDLRTGPSQGTGRSAAVVRGPDGRLVFQRD